SLNSVATSLWIKTVRWLDQSLDDVLEYFRSTHTQFMALTESLTDEEVLTPGFYAFTGSGSLYDWLDAYAAHDL
ncbi:MAG: DinB family protein, partial [Anaerolineae bacterium]